MAQWYVKKLSKLTRISVKTLYHYESIGLLKPSMRLDNGYRVYTEADLVRLQQILALKSFGFGLAQIKQILGRRGDVTEQFLLQSRFLEEKAQSLIDASQTLKKVVAELGGGKTVAWETIIKLIEVYNMTNELKKSWAGQVFKSEAALKEYAEFEAGLKARFTAEEKIAWEKKWEDLSARVRSNLANDPSGEAGIELGKQCMDMVNTLYGREHIKLRNTLWEDGYKKGNIDPDHSWAEPAVIAWLDKANMAYYLSCLAEVANEAGSRPAAETRKRWHALLVEMSAESKEAAIARHLLDGKKLNAAAKKFLQRLAASEA